MRTSNSTAILPFGDVGPSVAQTSPPRTGGISPMEQRGRRLTVAGLLTAASVGAASVVGTTVDWPGGAPDAGPTASSTGARLAAPVLPPDAGTTPPDAGTTPPDAGTTPAAAGVAAALDPLMKEPLRAGLGLVVVDPADGRVLYDRGGGVPRTPASVAKLFTAAAALVALG